MRSAHLNLPATDKRSRVVSIIQAEAESTPLELCALYTDFSSNKLILQSKMCISIKSMPSTESLAHREIIAVHRRRPPAPSVRYFPLLMQIRTYGANGKCIMHSGRVSPNNSPNSSALIFAMYFSIESIAFPRRLRLPSLDVRFHFISSCK